MLVSNEAIHVGICQLTILPLSHRHSAMWKPTNLSIMLLT